MTTAARSVPPRVQMEPANFLNLLIVDDECAIRVAAKRSRNHSASAYADSAEHDRRDTQNIDVVLLDLKLPGATALPGGIAPDRRARCGHRGGHRICTVQSAVNGAYDYVTKSFSMRN